MKRFIVWLAIIVAAPTAVGATVFASGFATGSYSIKYDNDGTWLCHTPRGNMGRTCTFIAPFISASYLKGLPESSAHIEWTKGANWSFCENTGGRLKIEGKAPPTLVIECNEP